jgi:putative oxidoreductase
MIKAILKVNDYSRLINLALLVLRAAIAILMLTHGVPKLMKIMGGNFNFSNPVGLGSTLSLILTVFAEFVCSLLIFLGLGTRLAVIPLLITMIVILFVVHANDPFFAHYNVILYSAGYLILLAAGSGKYSLDYLLQKKQIRSSR